MRVHARVADGRIISARETNDFMLTTGSRLTAEPPPPLPDGALGVCYRGQFLGGKVPEQADIDAAVAKVASDPSLLSPIERAHIVSILSKFSGRSAARTSAVGVTSNDSTWAAESARRVAANVAHVGDVQKTYTDFWDKQNKAMYGDAG